MPLKTSKGEKSRLFPLLCLGRKKSKNLCNGNADPTKLVKVLSALYEQNLVY